MTKREELEASRAVIRQLTEENARLLEEGARLRGLVSFASRGLLAAEKRLRELGAPLPDELEAALDKFGELPEAQDREAREAALSALLAPHLPGTPYGVSCSGGQVAVSAWRGERTALVNVPHGTEAREVARRVEVGLR
jgi:hypothetical protein